MLFKDFLGGDYALQADSPAYRLGFEDIPVDQIGCYQNDSRTTWPLASQELPQETPVLYRLK